MEYVLTKGKAAVESYISECRDLGFDIIEISSGFITLPADNWLALAEMVKAAGLK
jgi:phosphosulfolactate synthase (CoM biosynthesis protein A)